MQLLLLSAVRHACLLFAQTNRRRRLNADSPVIFHHVWKHCQRSGYPLAHRCTFALLRALQKSQHAGIAKVYSCAVCYGLKHTERQGNQVIHMKLVSVCIFRVLICWKQQRCWWFSCILCEWIQPQSLKLPVQLWLSRWAKCSTFHTGMKQSAGIKQSELRNRNNSGLSVLF